MTQPTPPSLLLIGFGAMGRTVYRELERSGDAGVVAAVLEHPERVPEVRRALPETPVVAGLDDLPEPSPALAVECAGHAGVAAHAEAVLQHGMELLLVSTGALADAALEQRLRDAAAAAGTRLCIPAGAVGGIDALAAARLAGLDWVTYTARKPPRAWKGTPAEARADLDGLEEAAAFFRGSAREAARQYPQNANVAATVGLAGLGLDATNVELVADPEAAGNEHQIDVMGRTGAFSIRLTGRPLPDNPKTSALAAYSVLRAIRHRLDAVAI